MSNRVKVRIELVNSRALMRDKKYSDLMDDTDYTD